MSIRSPTSSPTPQELKQRVITCLNKLADRDTLALASAELDSIAKNLTHDSFSPFINCLHSTDSACRSPVRKQCVALLSVLSQSHGDSLSPHLPKMVDTVLRRLRDPESSVRASCASAAADMSAHITSQPFSDVARPLIETLLQVRDANAQIGAALCLSAAVEAAQDTEADQLRKALPKIGKLLKSEGFKAKPALLGAIGSAISAGGAGTKAVLDWLVPCVTEFLSSGEWAARKAAAEALGRVAMAEEELAPLYKNVCLAALESKRFDKVKIVRETMNRALELWKEVPADSDEISSSPSPSISSIDDGSIGCFPSVTRNSSTDVDLKIRPKKKAVPSIKRSPSLSLNKTYVTTGQEKISSTNQDGSSNMLTTSKLDNSGPPSLSSSNNRSATNEPGKNVNTRLQTELAVAGKNPDEKVKKVGGMRSGSRIVPCDDEVNSVDAVPKILIDEVDERKDGENLSRIREQLSQIENQQSNLLDLLQKFIGSSQSGIQSLESRVNGVEMALDEISNDLCVSSSSGRISKRSGSGDTCCKLPGTEFLSPKFWRKTEGRFDCAKFPFTLQTQSENNACNSAANNRIRSGPASVCGKQRGNPTLLTRSSRNNFKDSNNTTGVSFATRLASQNLTSW